MVNIIGNKSKHCFILNNHDSGLYYVKVMPLPTDSATII